MRSELEVKRHEDWKVREAIVESMIPLIGRLYRQFDVVTSVYGRQILNQSVIEIIKAHRYARQIERNELRVEETLPVLQALASMELSPARIDVGKLAIEFRREGAGRSIHDFVKEKVDGVVGASKQYQPRDVVLYGFGRIGRLLARILIEKMGSGEGLRLRAVVVRGKGGDVETELSKRASLLRRDSVHGAFHGTISVDAENNAIVANGNTIRFIEADGPDTIDYTAFGIEDAIVIDNTGKWRDEEGLGLHLQSKGVSKVLLTAPGKGNVKNVVYGINHQDVSADDAIVSAASCTTNAIVPVLKCINDQFHIESGHVETVHAYTNDQNLIDNYHKGSRRGRAATLNMVITETGAASAVAKALPELEGKLTGNAIRVPTPNVSLAILNLQLGKDVTTEEVNGYLRDIALHSPYQKQIDFVNSPEVVSSDFVGSRFACVVDSSATNARHRNLVLYVWYDNEFGYSCQVVRLVRSMAGIAYPVLPVG